MIFPNSALPHPVDVASIHLREFLLYGSFHYHKSYRNPSFLLHCTTNSPLSAKNLRFLSTGAPAVSFCVEPSVSRRGTCDRRICTKPLARRTRGSYGFWMRDSRIVRGRIGLGGLVKDIGESVSRSGEAIWQR